MFANDNNTLDFLELLVDVVFSIMFLTDTLSYRLQAQGDKFVKWVPRARLPRGLGVMDACMGTVDNDALQ